MIGEGEFLEAARYARLAIDFDRYSVPGWRALAVIGRKSEDEGMAEKALGELLALDPLHHFVWAERYLAGVPAEVAGVPTEVAAAALAQRLGGEFPDQTLLELAIGYEKLGLREDALELLTVARKSGPQPLVHRAWIAWLMGDPSLLAGATDPDFAFPYRRESLRVLEWTVANSDDWVWRYLLALNLWAVDRQEEAAENLDALAREPDFGPLYVARAHLLSQTRGEDPEPDLRRAVELAPENRSLHIHLIRHYQNQGEWDAALASLSLARDRFPDDFNLDLLQARTLMNVGRALEATRIMETTHVLPSENGRESHRLYEQAHTLVALDALDRGANVVAREHLMAALEWPESLGQGRPYEPEERLVRFLLARVEERVGNEAAAHEAFEAVVAGTKKLSGLEDAGPPLNRLDRMNRLDLLAIPALHALGRTELEPEEFAARLGAEFPHLFSDLDGRILFRALTLKE